MKTNSAPKIKVLEFIKLKDEMMFEFELRDHNMVEAQAFIHSMRVELSRLRKQVREQYNKVPRQFKMKLISITVIGAIATVKLMKTISTRAAISSEVDEALQALAGGDLM